MARKKKLGVERYKSGEAKRDYTFPNEWLLNLRTRFTSKDKAMTKAAGCLAEYLYQKDFIAEPEYHGITDLKRFLIFYHSCKGLPALFPKCSYGSEGGSSNEWTDKQIQSASDNYEKLMQAMRMEFGLDFLTKFKDFIRLFIFPSDLFSIEIYPKDQVSIKELSGFLAKYYGYVK